MKGFLIVTLAVLAISQTYASPVGKYPAEDGEEDVLLPNAANCNSFYKCLAGVPTLMYCPSGLDWSAELNRCEYPPIANCKPTETEAPVETTSALVPTERPVTKPPVERPDHCPAEDGPDDVLLPNLADCSSFFKCLNGVPVELKCPAGQEWANNLQRCDYPEIANCTVTSTKPPVGPEPTELPVTKPPVERPDHCPAHDGPVDVLLPNPKDCGSFFKCQNGIPVKIDCPVNQEWANDLQRCDFPEIAKCSASTTKSPMKPTSAPNPTEVPVSKPPNMCPPEDGPEDVLLPNPDDCGSFFKCNRGEPILEQCPAGLYWNAAINQCDYPANVDCPEKYLL